MEDPLTAKVAPEEMVKTAPEYTVINLATAPAALIVGSLATSKIATVSIASGTPAVQLPGSVHEVPAFPVQEV